MDYTAGQAPTAESVLSNAVAFSSVVRFAPIFDTLNGLGNKTRPTLFPGHTLPKFRGIVAV